MEWQLIGSRYNSLSRRAQLHVKFWTRSRRICLKLQNGRSVGSLAFTKIDAICWFQEFRLNEFSTGWKDHLKDAGLFQMVRTHGKWGCGIVYGTTWCRWVLHSFVYSDFHQQWCPWWEVTTVLPAIGVLETFAHHDEASGQISSPLIWWCLCFAAFTWRSKLEWCLHRSLDFVFCEKEVLMANVVTFGSFENFAMKVVEF